MDPTRLNLLSALDAARAIRDGAISSEELVEACLARVSEVEDAVQAWAFLDPEHARAQARMLDLARKEGRPQGPLHGVPFTVKENIDLAGTPTTQGVRALAARAGEHFDLPWEFIDLPSGL